MHPAPSEPALPAPPLPRMRRFTRPEDLVDLEDMGLRARPETTTSGTTTDLSTNIDTGTSTDADNTRTGGEYEAEQERIRRYMDSHTTFLNSADTEGSGYIPDRATMSLLTHTRAHNHHMHDHDSSSCPIPSHSHSHSHSHISRTPVHYASSLAEDEVYTAPGTPQSFFSSPSLGYYSHASRPSSQTGFWVDQAASSLNLIMPSSALFVKGREPTAEGEKLGFVKIIVAGKNRAWHSQIVQDMCKWGGVIANDFDDDFLQERPLPTGPDTTEIDRIGLPGGSYASRVMQGSGSSQSSGQYRESSHDRIRDGHQNLDEVIVERFASSMVLPAWARAGLDEQDMQQEILVKNICFVDTPGCNSFNNSSSAMDLAVSYLGLQFQTTNEFFSKSAVSGDSLGRFLANNTTGSHSHVDACLYVIEGHLTDVDLLYMQRLQPWVNLIPVLIPQSASSQEAPSTVAASAIDAASARQELIRQLREHDIEIYGMEEEEVRPNLTPSPFSTDASPEDELSPPPLSLDEGPLLSDFTSPPFLLLDLQESGAGGDLPAARVDVDVRQLNVTENVAAEDGLPAHRLELEPQDLGSLRKWLFTDNLAALRHHTTLKFLRWRRRLATATPSPMYSSLESGSLRQRQYPQHPRPQHEQLLYPYQPEQLPGSNISTTTNSSLPCSSAPHQYQPLLTNLAGELFVQDHSRVSVKVLRMLDTHGQAFERIMLERQEAWRLALEGMEHEQRIEFLVQELRRWAMQGRSSQVEEQSCAAVQKHHRLRESSSSRGHIVGLGLEAGLRTSTEPSLADALRRPASRVLGSDLSVGTRRNLRHRGEASASKHVQPRASQSDPEEENVIEGCDRDDPLGLGLWMSQFFGAVGRGIVQVVVMIGMGSVATWIYTHLLEHRVTWVG